MITKIKKTVVILMLSIICMGITGAEIYAQEDNQEEEKCGYVLPEHIPGTSSIATNSNNNLYHSVLESSYDSRNVNGVSYITPVRDQGNLGCCWTFAALGACEANALKQGIFSNPDFSEMHLGWFVYNTSGVVDEYNNLSETYNVLYDNGTAEAVSAYGIMNVGGNNQYSVATLSKWIGAADETVAPYPEYTLQNEAGVTSVDSSLAFNSKVYLKNSLYIPMSDTSQIKEAIKEYGAVAASYYSDSRYYGSYNNYSKAVYYNPVNMSYSNHAILIVGWDDDFSKNNFVNKPATDGAWLVKNSWGSNWGMDGYFWISYCESSLNNDTACAYEVASTDEYDHNYQYDGNILPSAFGSNGFANVFTAQDNQWLEAVSFYAADVDIQYSIQIYTDIMDSSNPENGTAMLSAPLTGYTTYEGYYTVDLPTHIELKKDETFSVVISTDKDVYMYASGTQQINQGAYTIKQQDEVFDGQSFIRLGGGMWYDLGREQSYNLCIKAFTTDYTYEGNLNTDLCSFSLEQNAAGNYYLRGEIVVVEWVNGVSTVPTQTPVMTFETIDGSDTIEVFVTPTGTNTYYFDRFIEGLDSGKEYVFTVTSGDAHNVSPYRTVPVYLSTSTYGLSESAVLGKINGQAIGYEMNSEGILVLKEMDTSYIGNINSLLQSVEYVKSDYGNFISGKIIVVEWIENDTVSTVPRETPIMYFKSDDFTESLPVFITPTGTNTYYFDRNLSEDMDVNKEYIFTIESGSADNVSERRSMIVTTTEMDSKDGLLWETDTQKIMFKTDYSNGRMKIYAINK